MISLTLSQRGRAYSKSPVSSHLAVRKYDLCRSSGANSGCPRDQYADFSDAFSAVNSNVNHAAPALGRGGKGNSTKPHWWRRLLSGFSHDGKQLVLMRSTAVTVLTSSAAADRPTDRPTHFNRWNYVVEGCVRPFRRVAANIVHRIRRSSFADAEKSMVFSHYSENAYTSWKSEL